MTPQSRSDPTLTPRHDLRRRHPSIGPSSAGDNRPGPQEAATANPTPQAGTPRFPDDPLDRPPPTTTKRPARPHTGTPPRNSYLTGPEAAAKPPRHGGPGQPASFQSTGVALDVSSTSAKQAHTMLVAPGDELAKIERVGVASRASMAGQKTGDSEPFAVPEDWVEDDQRGRGCCLHGSPPKSVRPRSGPTMRESTLRTDHLDARSAARPARQPRDPVLKAPRAMEIRVIDAASHVTLDDDGGVTTTV